MLRVQSAKFGVWLLNFFAHCIFFVKETPYYWFQCYMRGSVNFFFYHYYHVKLMAKNIPQMKIFTQVGIHMYHSLLNMLIVVHKQIVFAQAYPFRLFGNTKAGSSFELRPKRWPCLVHNYIRLFYSYGMYVLKLLFFNLLKKKKIFNW